METPRLCLRPFILSDSEDVYAYASDRRVTQWTLWEAHANVTVSRLMVQSVVERYSAAPYFCWAIEEKRQGKVIGHCGFDDHWHRHSHRARFAYVLARDFWGEGIEWEAGREILRFGFTELELHRVTGRCLRDDTQAERIYQRLGLTYEGMLWDHVWS
ncbi:MAG: GNAT family N-acetyltransferase, partial [Sulfobacillus thermotolerans]|nr:GNAT family N-acetyltransferase [Sulfobacillus thermotolerans]